jgi:hypothetical protein
MKDGGSWCLCVLQESEVKVKIRHIGRGKFKVIEDEANGTYIGKIIDASDLIHCKFLE